MSLFWSNSQTSYILHRKKLYCSVIVNNRMCPMMSEIIAIIVICMCVVIWILLVFQHLNYLGKKAYPKGAKRETDPQTFIHASPELFASRVSALLDFYSDRAVAHASFFVASIFGLVTLLTVIQQLDIYLKWFSVPLFWWSIPIFFVFSYTGYYTLIRFNFYASIAGELAREISSIVPFRHTMLGNYVQEQEKQQQRKILILRKIIAGGWGIHILGFLYWILIGLRGFVVYSRFLHSGIEWLRWFALLGGMLVFPIVILPVLIVLVKRYSEVKL